MNTQNTLSGCPLFLKADVKEMVGPVGLEPTTKGFTVTHPFPNGADYLITLTNRIVRGGTL